MKVWNIHLKLFHSKQFCFSYTKAGKQMLDEVAHTFIPALGRQQEADLWSAYSRRLELHSENLL